jgi:Protein of unknown function (DUF3224)
MTQRAVCPFELTAWEPEEYDDRDGVTLTRTRVGKTFSGDLTGQSMAELLMASAPSGSAIYVGIERLSGSLQGRIGSFVLAHDANMSSEGQSLTLTIMRDSGTGDLRGIHGTGTITIAPDGAHTLTLDYALT